MIALDDKRYLSLLTARCLSALAASPRPLPCFEARLPELEKGAGSLARFYTASREEQLVELRAVTPYSTITLVAQGSPNDPPLAFEQADGKLGLTTCQYVRVMTRAAIREQFYVWVPLVVWEREAGQTRPYVLTYRWALSLAADLPRTLREMPSGKRAQCLRARRAAR
jgi:hypothetical protein